MIPNVPIEPLLLYQMEWDSTRCAVCHAPKWKYYPFCRSCSIKAQCAHLMEPFRQFRGISSADLAEISGDQDLKMFEHYDRARDFLTAVHAGRAHAQPDPPPISNQEVLERVSRNLTAAEQKILATIHNHYPAEIDKQRLADITGYAADGGGFNNYLGHLRTLGLIEGKGAVKCSEYLFVE